MRLQFIIFCILIAFGLWLMFYKYFIIFGRKVNKHFGKIKNELERDENEL